MTEHHQSAVTLKEDTPRKQTPGEMLRTQRESAGLSLQAVSEALHLTVHYIRSLENDDYAKLPGLTFVKGYFRAYARYLRMDVDAVLASYESQLAAKGLRQHVHDFSTTSIGAIGGSGRSDQSFAWALVAGVILVIALAAGWWFFGREMEVSLIRTPAAQSEPQTAATPAPGSATPGATQNLTTPRTQGAIAGAAQSFPQTSATTSATTTAPNGATANSTTPQAAADAGVAVINATLEARQEEEALLNNNAQAAGADGAIANNGATTGAVVADPTLAAAGTQPATTAQLDGTAPATTAPGTAAPLDSYTAPATDPNATTPAAGATATLPSPNSAAGIATQTPSDLAVDTTSAPTTVLDAGGQEVITDAGGARVITLRGTGNDRFEIQLSGSSWAEIHDAQGTDLFSDMLREGDKLSVEGTAPFTVLLGDARQVQANFNAQALDLSTLIRGDNTARFRLGAEGVSAIVREQATQQATVTE